MVLFDIHTAVLPPNESVNRIITFNLWPNHPSSIHKSLFRTYSKFGLTFRDRTGNTIFVIRDNGRVVASKFKTKK